MNKIIHKLTHKELCKQLNYNLLTGLFTRKISNCNTVKVGDIAGCKRKDGYIVININSKLYYAHILAWFYVHGYMPEGMIDHKDRIRHHNWILNLREASPQCQNRNKGVQKNNTSSVKGVSWDKDNKKWQSHITVNKKMSGLGRYKEFDEAVCNRLVAEQCLNWASCDSNSPAYLYVKENIQEMKNNA